MELTRLGKFINNNQLYINSGVTGFLSHIIIQLISSLYYNENINYYDKLDITIIDSYISIIVIPVTIHVILLWIPTLICKSQYNADRIQKCLYIMFICHYIIINVYITLGIIIMYMNPLSKIKVNIFNNQKILILGLILIIIESYYDIDKINYISSYE